MTKNRKRIFCLLAAFMLLITNSSIMSVFAVEDSGKSTDAVQLESSDETVPSAKTTPAGSGTPADRTNPVAKSRPAAEMDTTSKTGSISGNTASDTKRDVDIAPGSAVIDLKAGAGERTIYFDATQSKVTYSGNDNNSAGKVIRKPNSIPSTNTPAKVYYYAWKSTDASDSTNGEMNKEPSHTAGANTWADVWSANLPSEYDRIVFASYSITSPSDYQTGGTCTKELTIPSTLTSPCFYADNGDQCVYEQQWMSGSQVSNPAEQRRDGSWNEVYQVTKEGTKIPYTENGTEVRDSRKLYVNTTFFDYFSDKELNGVDRGSIGTSTSNPPTLGYTNRTYVTHKLLNTALSDYYKEKNVDIPLYFGHFQWKQNSEGTYYKSIGTDLNLFGYTDRDTFYHNNNSEYRKDCAQCNENEAGNLHTHATDVATQGLVDSSLSADNKLQMSGAQAPFFDKNFLEGANSYNTTLGKVYPSVYFPFTKVNDYWVFDSKNTNLRMTYDNANDHYFLKETTAPIKGYTNGLPTTHSNFFPFDDADSSGNTNALNYGFGMKMDINFRLTQDGQITDMDGNKRDIQFSFSGDDDIWIFIDGKLALDIGGGHGVVDGNLNFHTKEAYVSKVKNSTGSAETDKVTSFTLKGANTDLHTLTMYYMERGLWESNMLVSFNFPDNNVFSAEKEVDTTGIDSLFTDDTNFQNNVKNLVFDLDIRNLATHYAPRTVAQMDAQASAAGFIMRQESISDYGSVNSGKAEPANDAKYSLFERGSNGSETLIGTSNGNRVTNSVISLKDKQLARFTNKFRRGSYIVVTEKTSSMMKTLSGLSGDDAEKLLTDVFDTKYTIYSKDAEVSKTYLQADTDWVTGSSLSSLKDQSGVAANDGRTEKLVSGATDMNGTTIPHTTITELPDNAILFRNYINADSETVDMDLRVKYTNSFKTGAIAIKKAQATGSAALDANTSYSFTVTFDNVAGLKLEDTLDASNQVTADNKIQQTFTLKLGETKTFTGIPAGTKYTISEAAPTDGSTLKSVTDSLASGTVPTGVGKDTATISADNVVSGTITADESTSTVQTFTFHNNKEEVIKTGAIAIKKVQATGSAELDANTEYRFTVTFDNVTDPNWKDTLDSSYKVTDNNKIEKSFTLKLGETEKITGIPAGTKYTIKEEAPSDDSILKLVTDSLASGTVPTGVGKDTATISAANVVNGTITADESTSTVQTFTFHNYKGEIIKTGAIAVAKAQATGSAELNANTEYSFTVTFNNITDPGWKDALDSSYQVTDNNTIQHSFTLKLGETKTFTGIPAGTEYTISEAVPADGSTLQSVTDSLAEATAIAGVGKDTVTISNDKVVSGKITADDTTATVQTFTFYNMKEKTPDPVPDPTPEPKTTTLKITKVDSEDSDKTLSGAAFRLEKLTSTGSVDTGFTAQELTTPKSGVITFNNLSDGTYRLTETKAPSGYVQLKNPATIIIKDGKYTLENNGERTITNNTISFIIKNIKQKTPPKKETPKPAPKDTPKSNPPAKVFSLPKTGGIGTILYTLIGVACMGGVIVFFYLRKKKKA